MKVRRRVAGAFLAVVLWTISLVLTACAVSSGSDESFDFASQEEGFSVSIGDCFGADYDEAWDAVKKLDERAHFLAVSTASPVMREGDVRWVYLFVSGTGSETFAAVPGADGYDATAFGIAKMSEEEVAGVPAVAEIKVDAQRAYDLAMGCVGEKGPIETLEAFLVMRSTEQSGKGSGDEGSDPMGKVRDHGNVDSEIEEEQLALKWVFVFNSGYEIENRLDGSSEGGSEGGQRLKAFACCVDAQTGRAVLI